MKNIKFKIIASTIAMLLTLPVLAEEIDHSQHQGIDHSKHMMPATKTYKGTSSKQVLKKLEVMSKSGVAREAGFDGKYAMETTTVKESLKTRCAKASRGLIMLDNKSWAKCGGKPKGLAEGPDKKASQSMDHSQH